MGVLDVFSLMLIRTAGLPLQWPDGNMLFESELYERWKASEIRLQNAFLVKNYKNLNELNYDSFNETINKQAEHLKIAVEKKSFLYLAGTILEYSGGLNGKGFVFNNPNAQRTCGCGESFSL